MFDNGKLVMVPSSGSQGEEMVQGKAAVIALTSATIFSHKWQASCQEGMAAIVTARSSGTMTRTRHHIVLSIEEIIVLDLGNQQRLQFAVLQVVPSLASH